MMTPRGSPGRSDGGQARPRRAPRSGPEGTRRHRVRTGGESRREPPGLWHGCELRSWRRPAENPAAWPHRASRPIAASEARLALRRIPSLRESPGGPAALHAAPGRLARIASPCLVPRRNARAPRPTKLPRPTVHGRDGRSHAPPNSVRPVLRAGDRQPGGAAFGSGPGERAARRAWTWSGPRGRSGAIPEKVGLLEAAGCKIRIGDTGHRGPRARWAGDHPGPRCDI